MGIDRVYTFWRDLHLKVCKETSLAKSPVKPQNPQSWTFFMEGQPSSNCSKSGSTTWHTARIFVFWFQASKKRFQAKCEKKGSKGDVIHQNGPQDLEFVAAMVLKAQGKAQHVRYGFMLVISPCVLFTPYLSESNLSWFPPKNLLSCSFLLEEVQSPLACDLCKPTAGNDGQMFRAVPSIVDANPRLHKSVADPSVLSILNW